MQATICADQSPAIRVGFWLFRNRDWIPVPFYLLLVTCCDWQIEAGGSAWPLGLALVALGHWVRLWCVRHIGRSARSRRSGSSRLVTTGPYAYVRNPIYIGNIVLATGFVVVSQLWWCLFLFWLAAFTFYSLIVRWEEQLLLDTWGDAYRAYAQRVARWLPGRAPAREQGGRTHSCGEVLHREYKTFIATGLMLTLLLAKDVVL